MLIVRALLVLFVFTIGINRAEAACPGCCSGHGGISSSCSINGRVYCADGTVSPSCLCSSCGVPSTPPTPSCSGGRTFVGNMCVCPGGSQWAAIEGVCHTPGAATACGVERWRVKTATDTTVSEVDPLEIPTTVENLVAFAVPPVRPDTARAGTVERTTFVIDGTLTDYEMTDDSDYHLVIRGVTGRSMIVEIPHPACVGIESPYRSAITAARAAVDNALATTRTFKSTSVPIRITGLGFFDDIHGQRGVAPNGVELHPVIATTFTPVGSLAATPSVNAVEYYSIATDSYFLTARNLEKNLLDGLPNAFRRTGTSIAAKSAAGAPGGATAVCRFYYNDKGINSTHFYGTGTDCETLRIMATTNANFNNEGFDFSVGETTVRTGGACPPSAPVTVFRSFRSASADKTINHRYTVSAASFSATNLRGYVGEGPVYCAVTATDEK